MEVWNENRVEGATLPIIQETAYPCFRKNTRAKDLVEFYTPTKKELSYAESFIRTKNSKLGFLILLKSFQRLGYFVPVNAVPEDIAKHIAAEIGWTYSVRALKNYERSSNKWKHRDRIRQMMKVKPVGKEATDFLGIAMRQAALIKQDLVDIINVGIEELVRNRFELPAFDTLLREAKNARAATNSLIYRGIYERTSEEARSAVDEILKTDPETRRSLWNDLRQDPGKPTIKEINRLVDRLAWLRGIGRLDDPFRKVPYAKVRHLAIEACSFDAARMRAISERKRFALTAALIRFRVAGIVDDLCEILIRKMGRIHANGKKALAEYLEKNSERTDEIISSYKDVYDLASASDPPEKRLAAIKTIFDGGPDLVEYARNHSIYGSKNYSRFLWPLFRSYRAALFRVLTELRFVSTSSDKSLEEAIAFVLANKNTKAGKVSLEPKRGQDKPSLHNLSWIPDTWWYLVTGRKRRSPLPEEVDRRQLEVCLFSQIAFELKSADLCVEESDKFSDFRDQLISWEEFNEKLPRYSEITGIPAEKEAFVNHVCGILKDEAGRLDRSYPDNNKEFRIGTNGEPSLKKMKAKPQPDRYAAITEMISDRMPLRDILDILVDSRNLLNWDRVFGPLSGLQAKIKNPASAYAITTFCYGCNLGPTQTARSLPILDRKQIAWINQHHITEENLQKAIEIVVNAYNKFALPTYWGDTSSVSADGMKWDLYENNLMSEYHVRYGGYGGIGYYHVSDNYIALFSRFIPCGVYEAIYILDPFFENKSEVQPDTVHADTHGQSLTVFGLAFLLGIQLMPRIAGWKHLKIFKPTLEKYSHIEALFAKDTIDWNLIEKHLADMLRIVLSIQEGRVAPSTILRRLGTYSRKNKLYFAFQELGKVVRSAYLLNYIRDPDLRRKVNHATTVSEAFNDFIQYVTFGNKGIIAENTRDQQRKIIRYGHLVANILIFMNVFDQSIIMSDLVQEGHVITPEVAETTSPYRTGHLNRFGTYSLNEIRKCPVIDYNLQVVSPCP
jgi:TnpA family transposase